MNEIIELIKYSWINKILYTSKNITHFAIRSKNLFIIKLKLNYKQVTFIERNNNDFINVLILFLNAFNWWNDIKYQNITYNSLIINKRVFNNCIILFNSKKYPKWYIYTDNIKINLKNYLIDENIKKDDLIFLEIIWLIENKNISVRNLIKLWLKQNISREIFDYLKEIEIFIISKNNLNNKIYNFDNLNKINKSYLKAKINKGV